ncbi:acyl-CoA Delta-9 desaturase-like [Neocloeon triangulifer]|uniref:acyl-CoA Delta-9 desaturase-like n=1 Tax=Neocloeon triangulifer TaxID=2078957 RepID=UPI00286EFBAA|nr:acyl-CoA Delta-9 desaturase-like [Neocloeon triangulifer]
MAPDSRHYGFAASEEDLELSQEKVTYNQPLKWQNIASLLLIHLWGAYGLIYTLPVIKLWAFVFITTYGWAGALGTTAGAHRLWSHRSYKAKWPLRVILAVFFAIAGMSRIYDWVRDHRVHHKFVDTAADPHNINRGFFFAHCGWIMKAKHPLVIKNGRKLSLDDIKRDPIACWSDDHFILMKTLFCFVVPILVLKIAFGEPWWLCFGANMSRYMIGLNGYWVVNSVAHYWGSHPYDRKIKPTENVFVTIYAFGEGWHNFHHVFPWDYSSSEYGPKKNNMTTLFINFFALIGWATDCKTVTKEMAKRRAISSGDGTYNSEEELH